MEIALARIRFLASKTHKLFESRLVISVDEAANPGIYTGVEHGKNNSKVMQWSFRLGDVKRGEGVEASTSLIEKLLQHTYVRVFVGCYESVDSVLLVIFSEL